MGEIAINPQHNVFKQYRKVNYINPYVFGSSFDADAQAYITASGITSTDAKNSINYLIVNLKNNSLWTKIQALYPFFGTTDTMHKWNAKNPLDTDAGFRLTFFGSASFSYLGYQLANTNTMYANTHFIPSANQNINSNGITIVIGTNNPASTGEDTYEAGAINGSQYSFITSKRNNTNYGTRARMNNGLLEITGVNESRGCLTATRQNSTVSKLIKNGIVLATDSAGGGSLPTVKSYIGALNLNGSAYGFSSQRIQIVIFHEGLSDSEVSTLHSIIDASETIAGRKTW